MLKLCATITIYVVAGATRAVEPPRTCKGPVKHPVWRNLVSAWALPYGILSMREPQSTLAQDVLVGVPAIAEYSPDNERRVRYLISKHDLPCYKRGGIYYSRKSWLERYYSGETVDVANGGG
jgi:hypothetical protein